MKKPLVPLLSALVLGATVSMADVSLVGGPVTFGDDASSDSFDVGGTSSTGSFTFGAADDSVFLVTLYGIETDSVILTPTVTLDPTGSPIALSPLASAQSTNNGDLQAFVFAADLGTVSAGSLDFTVNWSTSARGAAVAYQLAGTSVSTAITDSSGERDTQFDIGPLSAGSFAVDMIVDGSGVADAVPFGSPTATGGYTASGNRGLNYGYYAGISGTIATGYDQGAAQVSVTAAFQAVPEPSAYAGILGLLGLVWVAFHRLRKSK